MEEIAKQLEQLNQTLSSQPIDWIAMLVNALCIIASSLISFYIANRLYKKQKEDAVELMKIEKQEEKNKVLFNQILSPLNIFIQDLDDNKFERVKELRANPYFYQLPTGVILCADTLIANYQKEKQKEWAKAFAKEIVERYFANLYKIGVPCEEFCAKNSVIECDKSVLAVKILMQIKVKSIIDADPYFNIWTGLMNNQKNEITTLLKTKDENIFATIDAVCIEFPTSEEVKQTEEGKKIIEKENKVEASIEKLTEYIKMQAEK